MDYEKLRELFYNEVFQEQEPETGEDGRQHGLYVIQNLINGRFYVGKHSRKQVDNYFGSGFALKGAVRKYGRENFQMKYFHWSESAEQLHADESEVLEILLNEIFDGDWSELKKCSYNLKLNQGYNSYSDETRAKMSEHNRLHGTRHFQVGDLNPMYGRTGEMHPNFGKQNVGHLAENFKGITIGINSDNEIVVFNGGQDINSRPTRDGKYFDHSRVYAVINGRRKSANGFKFHRTKDNEELEALLNSKFYDQQSEIVLETYLSSSSV